MKALRPFLWAAILVAAFLYATSGPRWDFGRWLRRGSAGPLWSEPASAATAYTPDEQNNIDIYKGARDATVNITSKVYQQDWFFGAWADGAGSGSAGRYASAGSGGGSSWVGAAGRYASAGRGGGASWVGAAPEGTVKSGCSPKSRSAERREISPAKLAMM